MKKVHHSKSGLLLIELMISILFFSLTAAMILQVFVKSHTLSRRAEALFQAQNRASSIAETLEDEEDYRKVLSAHFPELISDAEQSFSGSYDAEWKKTESEQAVYRLTVTWKNEDDMRKVRITVFEQEKEIYQLLLQFYRPDGKKG